MCRSASSVPPRMPLTCTCSPNRAMGGLGQILAGLLPGGQWCAGVGVDEGLGPVIPDGHPFVGVDELIMSGPPHLVIGRRRDRP
jgi:hypothetical protein